MKGLGGAADVAGEGAGVAAGAFEGAEPEDGAVAAGGVEIAGDVV